MLLRVASTPIMKSWGHTHHYHQPSCELSFSITSPGSWSPKNRAICRALSETDLKELSSPKLTSTPNAYSSQTLLVEFESEESETASIDGMETNPCFEGGGGCGGESGGGGSEQGGGNNNENEMDEYYKDAIKENPGSGLILGNYARFLKEVKGDMERAEEYCERAILAKSNDGHVLAMYGELIWETQRDGFRANTYFEQAVKSAPHNCYVLGSYARFMWDADGEEEEGGNDSEQGWSLIRGLEQAKLMTSFSVVPPLGASS